MTGLRGTARCPSGCARSPSTCGTRPLPEDGLPVPSAEEDTLARQGHLDLLRRIHGLPPNTREVVYLRAFGGLSFREIGDVLGRTETWARVTFYRGKEALRKGDESHEEHS